MYAVLQHWSGPFMCLRQQFQVYQTRALACAALGHAHILCMNQLLASTVIQLLASTVNQSHDEAVADCAVCECSWCLGMTMSGATATVCVI